MLEDVRSRITGLSASGGSTWSLNVDVILLAGAAAGPLAAESNVSPGPAGVAAADAGGPNGGMNILTEIVSDPLELHSLISTV